MHSICLTLMGCTAALVCNHVNLFSKYVLCSDSYVMMSEKTVTWLLWGNQLTSLSRPRCHQKIEYTVRNL